jgi:hypothetical protein
LDISSEKKCDSSWTSGRGVQFYSVTMHKGVCFS